MGDHRDVFGGHLGLQLQQQVILRWHTQIGFAVIPGSGGQINSDGVDRQGIPGYNPIRE